MSAAKHTQGPWLVTKNKHGTCGHLVAVVAEDRGDRALMIEAPDGDDSQAEANANLIVAAPDQNEALVEFDAAFAEFDPESRESRYRMRRAVIKARAAIAKATGGQS